VHCSYIICKPLHLKAVSTFILILFSLSHPHRVDSELQIDSAFYTQYVDDSHDFLVEVTRLDSVAQIKGSEAQQILLQASIDKCRRAYKKIEYLFDYFNTKSNYRYINGGPLPKVNIDSKTSPIIPPLGLQRLDELIYSPDLGRDSVELRMLTARLSLDVQSLIESDPASTSFSAVQLIEALRSGVIRIFTLGLTGFDTPGSGHGLVEAATSLASMSSAINYVTVKTPTPQDSVLRQAIAELFGQGVDRLVGRDFATFDRMSYLKEVVNPLYESLHEWQILHGLGGKSHKTHAQNYHSTNLFDESFLNLNYFSQYSFLPLDHAKAAELGRALFYDTGMSKADDMSCASCHQPTRAFTDGEYKSLTNTHGQRTLRNAPSLVDVAYSTRFFWDMREYDLERQIGHVVQNELEFGLSFKQLSLKLATNEQYLAAFKEIYTGHAKQNISRRTISHAIAAYLNTLTSFNSEFDQYVRGETETYSASKINGFNLFMGKANCGTCHFAPVFNGSVPPYYDDSESEVLGVLESYDTLNPILDEDIGRSANGLRRDAFPHFKHSFKTVTVRNVELTAPYMHNGSIQNLEDLIDFYDRGGGVGMGVDVPTQTLSPDPLNLTDQEKVDLINFLKSLTDISGLNE